MSDIKQILENIHMISNRLKLIKSISEPVVKKEKLPPPPTDEFKAWKVKTKHVPKPKEITIIKMDNIIPQNVIAIPIPDINQKIRDAYLNKHDMLINWIKQNAMYGYQKVGGNKTLLTDNDKKKFVIYIETAKQYQTNIENLLIPKIDDEYFLTKFVKTIYENISENTYPSGSSRKNHDGLNHLRSVANCAYLLSIIKNDNITLYNSLINNDEIVLKFILLAAMFSGLLRINEEGADVLEQMLIPANALNDIFGNFFGQIINRLGYKEDFIIQMGFSSSILFLCIVENITIPTNSASSDIIQRQLPFYILKAPDFYTNINVPDKARHALIQFGHFLDHCRFPQSAIENELRWSQLDTTIFLRNLLESINEANFMKTRKNMYIFEMNLLRDSGFEIKDTEFKKFSENENYFVDNLKKQRKADIFSENNRKKLPCYNIVGTKIDNKFNSISDNFDIAFDTIFNYRKYGDELKLIKPHLRKLKLSNTLIPLYNNVNLNNIQDYEDNYIIKQAYISTKYIGNVIRNNIDMSQLKNLYPKWFDWHFFIVDKIVASYTKEYYNNYNEILKYKSMYDKGLFSYLATYGTFKLTILNYLKISMLIFLILNSKYSTDIYTARGFKNNVKTFTEDETAFKNELDIFMKYFRDINFNIFEIIEQNNEKMIKQYMNNPDDYDSMKTKFGQLKNKSIKELWHVSSLDSKYKKNNIVVEPTFISTSLSYKTAAGYIAKYQPKSEANKCCIINIKIPKNTPAVLWVRGFGENDKSEHEILLPPGSRFRTISSKTINNDKTMYVGDALEKIKEITVEYEGTDVFISTEKFIDLFTDYLLLIDKKKSEDELYKKYKYEMYNLFTPPKMNINIILPPGYDILKIPNAQYWSNDNNLSMHPYINLIHRYLRTFANMDENKYALTYPFIYHIKIFVLNENNEIAIRKSSHRMEFIGGYIDPHCISRSILSLRNLLWHHANIVLSDTIAIQQIILDEFESPDQLTLIQLIKVKNNTILKNNNDGHTSLPFWSKINETSIGNFNKHDQHCYRTVMNYHSDNIIYRSDNPDDNVQNIVGILNTLPDFKNIIREGEQFIPVIEFGIMNKFETDILSNALNDSLCGLSIESNDQQLKEAFIKETNIKITVYENIVIKKIENWKKRNINKQKLLMDLLDSYKTRNVIGKSITEMEKKKIVMTDYNAMLKKEKPLAFKSKEQYDDFIDDLITVVKKKLQNLLLELKGRQQHFILKIRQKLIIILIKERCLILISESNLTYQLLINSNIQ